MLLRPDVVELSGAMRWVERRVRLVHHVPSIVIGLLADLLARCVAEVGAVRTCLKTDTAPRTLRTSCSFQAPGFATMAVEDPHPTGRRSVATTAIPCA